MLNFVKYSKRIISVSRRTDIPAFYGNWFMNRLKEGFVGYINPYGGQKCAVSLKPEDVICFVFWSKNYEPFIEKLKIIENMGYLFYFNYTITGLPAIFECNGVNKERAIDTLKVLSCMYSPKHINWRYDPIIISDYTDYDFHIKIFENIASKLEGYVERCYFSYAVQYGKVKRNFDKFQRENDIRIMDPDTDFKIKLANKLADIADRYRIKMFSCCGDYLTGPKIGKAHCISGKIVEELFYKNGFERREKATRKECGCTDSTDIGTYDTCPNGCIYCYANVDKIKAYKRFEKHDENASFLGYSKAESDKWIEVMKSRGNKRGGIQKRRIDKFQRKLF